MIVSIKPSKLANKRYRVRMDDGKIFDFGYRDGSTYIDHGDMKLRESYWKRHYANPTEKQLIDNLVPSPSLFSAYLLWGNFRDINRNIMYLNQLWKRKHSVGALTK